MSGPPSTTGGAGMAQLNMDHDAAPVASEYLCLATSRSLT
jgi:hypothetical protein